MVPLVGCVTTLLLTFDNAKTMLIQNYLGI
jgi:hypothetical protein